MSKIEMRYFLGVGISRDIMVENKTGTLRHLSHSPENFLTCV